ncbi:gamma-tubulin complex component 4-like isoform X1 [Lithobates pipiens]
MIHELLLALSGYPGSIFTWNKRSGLQVSQDLPFLHPSETSVLNLLCKLGTDYIRFTEFIEQYTGHVQHPDHHPSQQGQIGLHGIYLRAFCRGLDSILQPYRQALLDLEQEFLADPHLSISHINYSLDQFHLLFPSVMIVVEQIKSQKIHGCQLLETVYKHSCGGLPPVRSALEKILAVCHGVMYKQLSAWMLHGLLLDQYEEFFVRQGSASGNASTQPDEEDDDLGIGGLTGKQLRELQDLRLIEEENMLAPTLKQFSLRVEMLPSYIPVRVAEKMLFVGESVQMFENWNVTMTRTGSILKNQEDIFAAELHRLKQQPLFNLVDFESVLDRIRSTVAEHLWKLMVEESDLIGQLKIIKDFYLLGRGELFQAFIDIAQNMLKMPPTEHDINVAFQLSAHKVLLDDDNLLPLLHLTIDYHGKEHKDMSQPRDAASRDTSPREAPTSGWAALGLFYKVQWPLHILFTPAILEKNLIARLPDRGKKILDYTEKVRAAIAEHVIEKRAKSPVHQKEKFKPNRFYDCRASVNKKMEKHLLAQSTRGKAVVFRQWEAELRDGLLADEDVPGVSRKSPAEHQRADRATSSVEGSAPRSCPQYSGSESVSHIPDPSASATVRKQRHITPQHQQDQSEGRAQCSLPCSPVLICEDIELQNEPELTPVIPQTPVFSPWPEEATGHVSRILPPSDAAPGVPLQEQPQLLPPRTQMALPSTAVPPGSATVPDAVHQRLLRELQSLASDNRRMSRDIRRLTRSIQLAARQQTDHMEIMLARVNQQQNQAMEHLRLSLMEAISRHNAPLPGSSSASSQSSREPSPSGI